VVLVKADISEGAYRLCLHGLNKLPVNGCVIPSSMIFSTLMMEAIRPSETSLNENHTAKTTFLKNEQALSQGIQLKYQH
jgi:hypothetical protein